LYVQILIFTIKVLVFIYDFATYLIYALIQRPWQKRRASRKVRGTVVPTSDDSLCYAGIPEVTELQEEFARHKITTLNEAIDYALAKHADRKACGTRKAFKEFDETQKNGKVFKKLELGEYEWLTYGEIDEMSKWFSMGLKNIGHLPGENIVIFSDTRYEWLVAAIGGLRQKAPLCTLYATLGDDAIVHGINETGARFVLTSHDLLPKFRTLLQQCPNVERLVYFPDQISKTDVTAYSVPVTSFGELVHNGKNADYLVAAQETPAVLPSDTAIIMYTSGSTGAPKGVIISHRNLLAGILSISVIMKVKRTDIYLAYLPLAHVLELMGELMVLMVGLPLGYSSPYTMTDRATKIKRGALGDMTVLKPTIMPAVPLILDRTYKAILEKVASRGPFLKMLFQFGLEYKMRWYKRGWGTPICNFIVFRKIRKLMGGKVRLIAVGGAPLPQDTHNFIRMTLGAPVLQGYGLTETCAMACLMDLMDLSVGRVGAPVMACNIKLVNWDEGNYRHTDKPNPRGEIVVGGDTVAVGYYKNEEKTAEDFCEMDGRRWFKTGDIGEVDPDGALRIVDRKKDLVKLQFGEYVSLGKVEAELKIAPCVDNLCVYGDPSSMYVVAVVSPNVKAIKDMSKGLGLTTKDFEEQLQNKDLIEAVQRQILQQAKSVGLLKFEIPLKFHLTCDVWSPESGLVTSAFKIKRRAIETRYDKQIKAMYA